MLYQDRLKALQLPSLEYRILSSRPSNSDIGGNSLESVQVQVQVQAHKAAVQQPPQRQILLRQDRQLIELYTRRVVQAPTFHCSRAALMPFGEIWV